MKINMVKKHDGVLIPANDIEADKLSRFKNDTIQVIEIKLTRNQAFHGKVFCFFNFCFEFWKGDNEYQNEAKQFDVFREHLTCLAGYYDSYYGIDGRVRIEAKSLAYSAMSQEEFEGLYSALINAALKNINFSDDDIYNKLIRFF